MSTYKTSITSTVNHINLRPFHSFSNDTSISNLSIHLCADIWIYILKYITNPNPRFIWDYKNLTHISYNLKIFHPYIDSATTFYIDTQELLDRCVTYYNKQDDSNLKITLFLGIGTFTIPTLKKSFHIYGCYSNQTEINETISILNTNCSFYHLIFKNLNKAVHMQDSKLFMEDCLICNCMIGFELKYSSITFQSCSICYNNIPAILDISVLEFNNSVYSFNTNEILVTERLVPFSKLIFDKDCSVYQNETILTSLEHEIHRRNYERDCEGSYLSESWTERKLSATYDKTNKIYIFFTYFDSNNTSLDSLSFNTSLDSLSFNTNNFYFGPESTYMLELDPEWIDDCLLNCQDNHININKCSNFLTFSENTMNTRIFSDIVFKIISNSSVKSINISQIDYKWFVLLKLYYHFIGGKKLKWIQYGEYCNFDLWEHSPDTIDDNVKPFWENFKIKYVVNLFKHAGFFVKNGEIFLQKPENNKKR